MAASRASHRPETASLALTLAARPDADDGRDTRQENSASADASPDQARTTARERTVEFPLRRHKILLVDDDPLVLDSLNQVLENEGYEVWRSCDGVHAVREFLTQSPDLVLLDLKMPGMNGLETFALMEKISQLVPCILITAYPNQYPRVAELKVDGFMEKPLDLPLLLDAIRFLVEEPLPGRIARLENSEFKTLNLNQEISNTLASSGSSGKALDTTIRPFRNRRWS